MLIVAHSSNYDSIVEIDSQTCEAIQPYYN